jgi:hypothetical protein
MIVDTSLIVRLAPFESTGQVILIPASWTNDKDDYFQEYYLLDFYTPTGLNEPFAGKSLFSEPGLRIIHVNANKLPDKTNNQFNSPFKYDNSYTSEVLVELVDPTGNFRMQKGNNLNASLNNMLFETDEIYESTIFPFKTPNGPDITLTIYSISDEEIIIDLKITSK